MKKDESTDKWAVINHVRTSRELKYSRDNYTNLSRQICIVVSQKKLDFSKEYSYHK
jgi:hypothetical protein